MSALHIDLIPSAIALTVGALLLLGVRFTFWYAERRARARAEAILRAIASEGED